MRNNIKDINIKKPQAYYFFNDIVNIKDFDPNNIKIDEKSYKNIMIYYLGYEMIKNDLNICSVNPLHFISGKMNGCLKTLMAISI